jgi:hypothetical protein
MTTHTTIEAALDAITARDWARLKPLLHPYLQWRSGIGPAGTIRGRTRVLAYVEEHPPTEPPATYELRDGQIYRWG